jgi:hypothetical protein
MIEINFKNIEEQIFLNKEVREILPEFRPQFDLWRLSQMLPGMRSMAQKSIFEVLNGLEQVHIEKLKEYFKQPVLMNRLNDKLVDHYNFSLEGENELCKNTGFQEFCITRNKDEVKATFWR